MSNFKPHILCFLSIIFVLLQAFISIRNAIDIQLHDHYFVIGRWHVVIILIIPFLLLGFLYWKIIPFQRKWIHGLAMLQIGFLLVTVVLICIVGNNFSSLDDATPSKVMNIMDLNNMLLGAAIFFTSCSLIALFVVLIGQWSLKK